jgi:hypothetical protein
MGKQIRQTRSRDTRDADVPEQAPETRPETPTDLLDSLDDLLDEVDALITENEEHLANFTQLSGE